MNNIDYILSINLYLITCKILNYKSESNIARKLLNYKIKKILIQKSKSVDHH